MRVCAVVCVRVCVSVRAYVRSCVRACVHACMRTCVVHACMCIRGQELQQIHVTWCPQKTKEIATSENAREAENEAIFT